MAERPNAAVLKTVVPQGTRGSNPLLSAFARRSLGVGELVTILYEKRIWILVLGSSFAYNTSLFIPIFDKLEADNFGSSNFTDSVLGYRRMFFDVFRNRGK